MKTDKSFKKEVEASLRATNLNMATRKLSSAENRWIETDGRFVSITSALVDGAKNNASLRLQLAAATKLHTLAETAIGEYRTSIENLLDAIDIKSKRAFNKLVEKSKALYYEFDGKDIDLRVALTLLEKKHKIANEKTE